MRIGIRLALSRKRDGLGDTGAFGGREKRPESGAASTRCSTTILPIDASRI
jgi:hypothetical protein